VGTLGRTFARLAGVAVLRALVVLLGFVATASVAGAAWAAQDVALDVHTGDAPALTSRPARRARCCGSPSPTAAARPPASRPYGPTSPA
jgi:hypothetical protein